MDAAAFKVSNSIGKDVDTAALRAARAKSSSSSGAMGRYMHVDSIGLKAHVGQILPRHTASREHTIGRCGGNATEGFKGEHSAPQIQILL